MTGAGRPTRATGLPRPARWAVIAGASGLLSVTLARPFAFLPDDALFYLVVGRNVARGRGVTLNGVVPTNGVQPLWQAVVAAAVTLCRCVGMHGAASQVRVVVLLGWGVLAATLVLLDGCLRRAQLAPAARLASLAVMLVLLGGAYGTLATEANLVALMLVAALRLGARVRSARSTAEVTRRSLAWGVVLGGLLLARLDTALVALPLVGAVALVVGRRGGPAAAMRAAGPAAAVATCVLAPYLAWNVTEFAHLMPISGAVKLHVGAPGFTPSAVGASAFGFLTVALVCGAGGLWRTSWRRRPVVLEWASVLGGAVASSAFYLAWSPGKLTNCGWYHVPHILALALGLALLVDRVVRTRPVTSGVAIAGIACVLVAAVCYGVIDRAFGVNQERASTVLRFSEGMARLVPSDSIVATVDSPGSLALLGRQRVVALDGLTGDFKFQEDLERVGASCTLARLGVTYLVTSADDELEPVAGATDGSLAHSVSNTVRDANAGFLVVRPADRILRDADGGFTLWRFRPTCA